MQPEFIFTEAEYAKIVGISKEGVRSRRRDGKLEGEYIQKDNRYFYARPRVNPGPTVHKHRTRRVIRRGAHKSGAETQYPNNAFKQHNELKMLAKLKTSVDPETLDLLPEAVEIAKQKKQDRIRETIKATNKPVRKYSDGIYNPRYVTPTWRSLSDVKRAKKGFSYY